MWPMYGRDVAFLWRMCGAARSALPAVPRLPDRNQISRLGRILLNLAADVRDVCVHRAAGNLGAVTPDLTHEFCSRDHAAAAPHQRGQQVKGTRREIGKFA